MRKKFLLTSLIIALLATLVVANYYRSSDCCKEPVCKECLLEGEIFGCDCDEHLAKGEFDKVCDECKVAGCTEEGHMHNDEMIDHMQDNNIGQCVMH
jgi:hypothetical protein